VRERDTLQELDGRIILKRIFKKWNGRAGTRLIRFRIVTGGGNFGFYKMRGFLEYLRTC
jgi:hypothetical protein